MIVSCVTPRIEGSLKKRSVVAMAVKRPVTHLIVAMQTSTKRGVIIVAKEPIGKKTYTESKPK